MNILFIVKEFPHSKIIGGPIIIYNRVKYLSRNHLVSLIAFADDPSVDEAESVARFTHDLRLVPPPAHRSALRRARDWLTSPVPPYFLLTRSDEMYEELGKMVAAFDYDVIISEYSMVAQYLYENPDLAGIKRVMSVHECYYLSRRKALKVRGFSREGVGALHYLKGLKKFEFDMYADSDRVLTLTSEGKEELLAIRPGLDISVVPHGVDVESFCPVERDAGPPTVMFLGNYPHDPNRDAVVFYATGAWPRVKEMIPGCRFLVVGRGPTPDMLELAARDPSIEITGEVQDVKPHFHASDVFVCPVRMGGGFRGKVLEAMACGVPVVSTALGAEGVPAKEGENILLADTPEELARQTVRLLQDDALREKIAAGARELMVERYSWQKGVEILEEVLEGVVGDKSPTGEAGPRS
ncbi:MAG: glycosyltransferase family 4 protein [Actinobacteria bacterium]|nr:glycosyltransferase family 4 protein [Actinomycetota bacterium]